MRGNHRFPLIGRYATCSPSSPCHFWRLGYKVAAGPSPPAPATPSSGQVVLPGLGRNLSLPAAVAADHVEVPLERMRPADEHIGRSAPGTARPLSLVGRLDPVRVRRLVSHRALSRVPSHQLAFLRRLA